MPSIFHCVFNIFDKPSAVGSNKELTIKTSTDLLYESIERLQIKATKSQIRVADKVKSMPFLALRERSSLNLSKDSIKKIFTSTMNLNYRLAISEINEYKIASYPINYMTIVMFYFATSYGKLK